MKKLGVQVLWVTLLVLAGRPVFAQESVMLKYGFEKGKSYVQELALTQHVVQSMGGQEIKVDGEISSRNSYVVEEVGDSGNATVLMSVLEISVRQSAMGQDTTLNYKDLTESIRAVYSPEGKILTSASVDSSEAGRLLDQVDPGKLVTLPGKVVQTGEKWTEQIKESKPASGATPLATEITGNTEYTLAGKELHEGRECFRISTAGDVAVTGKGTQMGMELFVEGSGKTKGFFYFDPANSLVVYQEVQVEMEMSVAVTGPQSMTIPMTQTTKTIYRFREE